MVPTLIAIIWFVGSIVVGLFSRGRKLGFWGGFVLSILFTPIIMVIVLMITQPRAKTGNV